MKQPAKTAFVAVDKDTAPLLLELASKAVVAGPQAGLFAKLYDQIERAAALVAQPAPKPGKASEA